MMKRLLERVGLGRPELRAWAMYDWANSAFVTTMVAAVFPIYFANVSADGLPKNEATARFAMASTVALTVVALLSPFLGAVADYAARRKLLLGVFQSLGVLGTLGICVTGKGDWAAASLFFTLANIGLGGAFVFYDALLPHIAKEGELDRVSSAGYALGYLGGGLLLVCNLLWIQRPEWFGLSGSEAGSKLSFLSVAIWWSVFSLPLYFKVREPKRLLESDESTRENAALVALRRLAETFKELRRFKNALLMLVAFLLYNDGISTIIRMAAIYATELNISQGAVIGAFLLTQFVGIPFAFLFGMVADRIGAKPAVFISLVAYVIASVLGYLMTSAAHFFALAVLIGMVQGGSQALSRSLFASMVPRHKSSEFFAFFGVFEKVAGILGPALFAVAITATGSSRTAVLSVVIFFVAGATLLWFVDVEGGRRAAQAAEADVRAANGSR